METPTLESPTLAPTPKADTTQRFDVHVYATVRVKIPGIAADTAKAAAEMAEEAVCANPDEWFRKYLGRVSIADQGERFIEAVEFAEEVSSVLVDGLDDAGERTEVLYDRISESFIRNLKIEELGVDLAPAQGFAAFAGLTPAEHGNGR